MRSGGCAVQQELAGDAAAVMHQAVSLARRRGHAQVTPLHAASAMLADAGGLLRAACLRSRASSHPLQCKALELCFNVALNRLATSSNTASSTSASPNPKPKEAKDKVDVIGDAARVLDCMASGRDRCVVVVGESAPDAEGVVKAVMDKVSKGDLRLQHGCLKNAQFVPFAAASFQRLPREEVEARVADLRALAREGCAAGKGVVLVLEDLGYAAEAWSAASWKRSDPRAHGRYYCPVEHAVMVLSSLVRGGGGRGHDMFWLLGFGTYASYTSCRSGQPSLEAVLELHPVVVPEHSLALSLGGDSEITHCGADMVVATAASVPSWIRRSQQGPVLTGSELTLSFFSPASPSFCGFTHYDANMSCEPWHDLIDRGQPLLNHGHDGPMAESCDQQLLANPKSNSSDAATETAARCRPKFTELTAENLKILCSALERRVPRHRDLAAGIASAVLQRRSGVTRTTRPSSATWLLFQGRNDDGKAAMARELARLVFGSYAEFTCITAAKLTLAPSGSNSGDSLKRQRSPDNEHGYMQRFYEAIRENPHRVVMIDGVEYDSDEAGIKNAMATGTVRGCDGDTVSLEDAIVVSCQVSEWRSRVSSPRAVKLRRFMGDVDSKAEDDGAEKGAVPRLGLDLNACAAMDGEGEEAGSSSPNDMEILKAVDGVFFFQY
ncbi:uncharacterized protein C2845_PM06G14220 [Panicum miliaceum]|uniref:Clp R domain-containing protein n=1 Tax=Panicum miliaceum TaxID=4540 RepID=A0A3L6R8S0_PANMI|nr:uncharacterized protein C2845_PM06G14220 [Panicum miliaceum]